MEINRQLLNSFLTNSDTDERTFLLRLNSQLTPEILTIVMLRLEQPVSDSFPPTLLLQEDSVQVTLAPYHDADYIAFMRVGDEPSNSQKKQAAVGQFLSYMKKENISVKAWACTLNCSEIGLYTSIQTCRSVLKFKYYSLENFHHMYYHPVDIEKYMSLMCHKLLADISALEVEIDWFNHTLQDNP